MSDLASKLGNATVSSVEVQYAAYLRAVDAGCRAEPNLDFLPKLPSPVREMPGPFPLNGTAPLTDSDGAASSSAAGVSPGFKMHVPESSTRPSSPHPLQQEGNAAPASSSPAGPIPALVPGFPKAILKVVNNPTGNNALLLFDENQMPPGSSPASTPLPNTVALPNTMSLPYFQPPPQPAVTFLDLSVQRSLPGESLSLPPQPPPACMQLPLQPLQFASLQPRVSREVGLVVEEVILTPEEPAPQTHGLAAGPQDQSRQVNLAVGGRGSAIRRNKRPGRVAAPHEERGTMHHITQGPDQRWKAQLWSKGG